MSTIMWAQPFSDGSWLNTLAVSANTSGTHSNNSISRVSSTVCSPSLSFTFFSVLTGGMILFSVVLNSFVHVIMYSYYFAALFGPAVQRKLESIKKSITVIQMVSAQCLRRRWTLNSWRIIGFLSFFYSICFRFQIQFTIILTQCVLGLAKGCDIPKILVAIYVPNVTLIFYMFYDFFKKAYKKKATDVQKAQKAL